MGDSRSKGYEREEEQKSKLFFDRLVPLDMNSRIYTLEKESHDFLVRLSKGQKIKIELSNGSIVEIQDK